MNAGQFHYNQWLPNPNLTQVGFKEMEYLCYMMDFLLILIGVTGLRTTADS
jgi:hypothetical protein